MASKFERTEIKYLVPKTILNNFMEEIKKEVNDKIENYTICNIYYDTDDYLLIRRSIEKPVYKEKLRIRTYGIPNDDDKVFIEIKKKFKSTVYKRRTDIKYIDFNYNNLHTDDTQIGREIEYFSKFYKGIKPKVYISYSRVAFNNKEVRISFDDNIMYRTTDLNLKSGTYGTSLLNDAVIMEIKINSSIPLWLTKLLTDFKIYKTSFSKYGNAYKQIQGGM